MHKTKSAQLQGNYPTSHKMILHCAGTAVASSEKVLQPVNPKPGNHTICLPNQNSAEISRSGSFSETCSRHTVGVFNQVCTLFSTRIIYECLTSSIIKKTKWTLFGPRPLIEMRIARENRVWLIAGLYVSLSSVCGPRTGSEVWIDGGWAAAIQNSFSVTRSSTQPETKSHSISVDAPWAQICEML